MSLCHSVEKSLICYSVFNMSLCHSVENLFFPKNIWKNQTFALSLQANNVDMRIIAKSTLTEYYTRNPQAKVALEE